MTTRFFPAIFFGALLALAAGAIPLPSLAGDLFDHAAIRDPSTLDVRVVADWHEVAGPVPTRQKVITILVHEVLPGQPYRIPVRFIVPADRKAKGFHLTGGHGLQDFDAKREAKTFATDRILLENGVGRVLTMVQVLDHSDQKTLGDALGEKFIETLDPKFSIQYYGWPLTLMKAITAAEAETGHFEKGKIAMSGGSKNGATPSVVLNVDDRTTAVHGTVSPIWDSPLRLCDDAAWQQLKAYNKRYAEEQKAKGISGRFEEHPFLGGTYGPIYNRRALAAGHSWQDLQQLAEAMADKVFITRNLEALRQREAEFLFRPGTHDFVCFDVAWGGKHHPDIPLYLQPNSGHGIKPIHPQARRGNENLAAFLYQHFFEDFSDSMLRPPTAGCEITSRENALNVAVTFPKDSPQPDSGRIWWIYDRGPDGSAAYLRGRFPDDQWADMKQNQSTGAWTVQIPLEPGHDSIDFFSNHGKTLEFRGRQLPTVISSPYQRVLLK